MASNNLIRQKVGSNSNNWKSEFEAPTPSTQLTCPNCGLQDLWRNGYHNGIIQRWLCNSCGYRFSNTESLKGIYDNNAERRISVSSVEGTKNLVKVETKTKDWLEGATKNTDTKLKTELFDFSWSLHRDGYAESTNKTYTYLLRSFMKNGANLNDPESVKTVIAKQNWSNGRKQNAVKAYDKYSKMHDIEWKRPIYKTIDKPPFIPTEQEINSLISGCSQQMAAFLQY